MSRLFSVSTDKLSINTAIVATYPFTISAWFKTNNVANQQAIFYIMDSAQSTNHQFRLEVRGDVSGDPLRAVARSTSQNNADTSSAVTTGVWHHGCGVFTSATSRAVFLDGGSKGTNATSTTPVGLNRTSVGLDDDAGPTAPFDGLITDITLWNEVLSDAEVAQLAAGVAPETVHASGIVGRWRTNAGASPETDSSGNGNDLVVTGATYSSDEPFASAPPNGWEPRVVQPLAMRRLVVPY